MTQTSTETRAFVIGPPELADRIALQFRELGMVAVTAKTPANETELLAWLASHASDDPTFIHPGLSFWADRPEFPQIVESFGFFPVCPSARALSLSLNKLNVMIEAEAAGIPHLAIGFDPLMSLREIVELLDRTGERFPIVLKSLKIAQGHGIQVVSSIEQLREIVPVWFEQLTRRYGEASVLVERCPPSARHLVVPFAADGSRFLEIFPTIDASLQTRWRRMIQFIPASDLGRDVEAAIVDSVKKWVKHLGFSGIGCLEFLVDGPQVYLIDASGRLPAAFPLWEELGGVRSIEWQLASLGQLPVPKKQKKAARFGAGISLRFYAEDPIRQIPCPGYIRELTEPFVESTLESETIWTNRYASGRTVPWTSTGVIGELFVFGKDRKSVLEEARKSVKKVWIAGSVQTNRRFLLEHLEHPFVRENLIHAGFTDEDFAPTAFPEREMVVDLVSLAGHLFQGDGDRWIAGGQWVVPESARVPKLIRREDFAVSERFEETGFSGETAGGIRFLFEPTKADRWLVHYGVWSIHLRRVRPGRASTDGTTRKATNLRIRNILALAPGRVHALLRHPGEVLAPHDRACVVESIGILVPHAVPVSVRLLEWKVAPGEVVQAGHELAVLELLS
jgi:acetyl-CoA carboxylase, biotin carboxylase subunit